MTPTPATDAAIVARRRVYYLAGFDTRSPRFYHQLYRTEAMRQQRINGCEYAVGELQPTGPHSGSFTIETKSAQGSVDTVYTFLQWSDIVRQHWPASPIKVALGIPAFYWHYAKSGALLATRRVSRTFFWIILLPLLYASVGIVLGALAALVGGWLAFRSGAGALGQGAAAVVSAGALLAGILVLCERQRVFWLMRAWTYMVDWARRPEATRRRWSEFARQIESGLQADPVDEVLIVGHSAGAMAAISVAAHWLKLESRSGDHQVKLVTIGNATPLLGLLPQAQWFRDEIVTLRDSTLPWIDYTAPGDPLCYALVSPFTGCGLEPASRTTHKLKSARFDRMFDAETYREIRRDFFRVHFQYLMATDHAVENDYFSLTAGPRALVVDATVV